MTAELIDSLKRSAGTRSDTDAMLMREAAGELEHSKLQINSLLRAVDLLSHDVLEHVDETKKICDQMFAAIVRHLGPPPNP